MRAGLELTFVHAQGLAASLNDVTAGRIPILFEVTNYAHEMAG